MDDSLIKYLNIFKKLRIDRSHGIAPHKPILLISVLQTFQKSLNNTQRIYITPELVALFKSNWNYLVTSKHLCRFFLPFYHLKSEKFWKLIPKPGFEKFFELTESIRSFSSLNAALDYAFIEEDFFNLIKIKKSNEILIQFLLDEYFPFSKSNYKKLSNDQEHLFNDLEFKILEEPANEYSKEIKELINQKNEEEIYLRGCLFKREIPKIYNNTCCISGMRIDATISISMIDACHIIPFSESYDDTITNGIALCPNLHRAFDRGLISISDDYNVLVKKNFIESMSNFNLKQFENKKILLPNKEEHFPLQTNLNHHRNRFNF